MQNPGMWLAGKMKFLPVQMFAIFRIIDIHISQSRCLVLPEINTCVAAILKMELMIYVFFEDLLIVHLSC